MLKTGLGLGLDITELRLGLPGGDTCPPKNDKKRVFSEVIVEDDNSSNNNITAAENNRNTAQTVGWPPVRSYRIRGFQKSGGKLYVKVGMDGTPFMRKIDLKAHKAYSDLAFAFQKLFGCVSDGSMVMDADGSEYIAIYEDRDGDWMLLGDVPWEMFMGSCKRLRLMKRSDAKGVQLQSRISEHLCHAHVDAQIECQKLTT